MSRDRREHPPDPVARLCQMDGDESGKRQPYVGMSDNSGV